MELKKTTGPVLVALGLLALSAGEAAAQAPTLTYTVSGTSVTIQWSDVPGATGYDLFVTGAISGQFQLPATTLVRVIAPPGTYNVQVRGRVGTVQGPLSNQVTIVVGAVAPPPSPTCGASPSPSVTATTNASSVTVNWSAVAGATGYVVQFSRFSGGTELVQNVAATQTSHVQSVAPFVGTFYVRVVATTPCGNVASSEVAFTITGATAGPRAPDPVAGQLCVAGRPDLGNCIPISTLAYASAIVNQVAAQNPFDVANSCRETGGNNNFMFKALRALRLIDARWGMNDKRGNRGDLSQDILSYNPTDRPDNGESEIYLFDIIGNHCPISGSPSVNGVDTTIGYTLNGTWLTALANPSLFGTRFGARWTIDEYLRAGFTP
jgi:hypothetical protein